MLKVTTRNPHQPFRRALACLGLMSLAASWAFTATAGDHTYNFDPPNGDPALQGFILFSGTGQAANAWKTNGGASGQDGDGWLEITPAADSQNLGVLFPLDYFTNTDKSLTALPLKGFFIEADVRIGNSSDGNGRPADGFSISYAKSSGQTAPNTSDDPVIYWGKTGATQFRGFAGGDSVDEARQPASFNYATGQGVMDPTVCSATTAENGTKTGVSVQFDTWQGNTIVDATGQVLGTGNDNVGWRVHFNGKMLVQLNAVPPSGPLPSPAQTPDPTGANVNGLAVCPALNSTDYSQPVTDPQCVAAVCQDVNTIETGPHDLESAGDVTNLCWTHFSIELTNNLLTVTYKGRTLIDHFILTNYQPFVGQLVMAGRTGGNNENRDIDNVHIVTYPSVQAVFGGISSASAYINDFSMLIQNLGPAIVTNVSVLTLDDVDIKSSPQTTITLGGTGSANNTIKYSPSTSFASGSAHTVVITYSDANGTTSTSTVGFTTTPWTTLPASASVPGSSVDINQPGFLIAPHQTTQSEPNRLYWADQQLQGLHGTNKLDLASFPLVNGEVIWNDVVDLGNDASPNTGQFSPDRQWGALNVPAVDLSNDDNLAVGFTAYLYFPTPGLYVMGGNSDDGLRVTFAANSHDVLGTRVPGLFADVGRGIGSDQNLGAVVVTNAGYYGFRYLFYNGGGGCNVEWYMKSTPAGTTNVLVNDTLNNPNTAIKAYAVSSAAPPYCSYAEPPLDDNRVRPDDDFKWQLTDGATTVKSGSVALKLNGGAQSPSVTTSGGITTISLPHTVGQPWTAGTNTVDLTFQDSANANYAYHYSFEVPVYTALSASAGVDLSKVDTTKPGFNMTMYQVDQQGGNSIVNREHVAEQVLAGLYGPNVAKGSTFSLPGMINFDIAGPDGNFTTNNGFVDQQFPGLPGNGTTIHTLESFAVEFTTWVAFPAEGSYMIGFNSDDGFWTKLGWNKPSQYGQLTVTIPANIAGDKLAVLTSNRGDGVGTQPIAPITGKLVRGLGATNDPALGCGGLSNAAQVSGNIALIERGVCGYIDKANDAVAAGAVAVIIANNRPEFTPADGWFPIEMTGGNGTGIPALMIDRTNYFALTNALAAGDVVVTINPFDKTGNLADADVGRGASDTMCTLYVPAPGAYPLRTVYWQGGGGGNAEWFSRLPQGPSFDNGANVLLNNVTNSNALLTYQKATVVIIQPPKLSVGKQGNSWVLTYEGTLYSSSTVNGAYAPVSGASSPYTVPANTRIQFYRAHNP